MITYYYKLNQMLVQIIVIVPDVYSILGQINTCPKHLEGSY